MGQYYKAYIENEDGIKVLYSWDYGSGLKLMEHSWLGNDFVNAAYTLIDEHPSRVGWIGDYSTDVGVDEDVYRLCWDDAGHHEKVAPNDYFKNDVHEGFLVNYSKEQIVDIAEYAKLANDDGWVTNPLPLLTAIGNGLGGGDYHENCRNADMVGYWYMDVIAFEHERHSFTDITSEVIFKE